MKSVHNKKDCQKPYELPLSYIWCGYGLDSGMDSMWMLIGLPLNLHLFTIWLSASPSLGLILIYQYDANISLIINGFICSGMG